MKHQEFSCHFCSGKMQELHILTLGDLRSKMWKCTNCSYWKVDPEFPSNAIEAYYKKDYFQAHEWEITKARILSLDYWAKVERFAKGDLKSALEIGAGYGFFASKFQSVKNIPIDLIEPSNACIEKIQTSKLRGSVYRNIDQICKNKKYDVIFSFHVLEHLQEPNRILEFTSSRLNSKGLFISLTPNGAANSFKRYHENWGWCCSNQHYQFFSENSPNQFFKKHGFHVVTKEGVIPAPIHYPSAWHAQAIKSLSSNLESNQNRNLANLLLKAVKRKIAARIASWLAQNKTNNALSRVEIVWSRLTKRKPFDELLLVLRRVD